MRVFISYAVRDTKLLAFGLDDALESVPGLSCWVDRELERGESWAREIERQIDACDLVVVLLSPDVNRVPDKEKDIPPSFVLKEISRALYHCKPAKLIMPVMAETTTPPIDISGVQYVDVRGQSLEGAIALIVEEVCKKLRVESPKQRAAREAAAAEQARQARAAEQAQRERQAAAAEKAHLDAELEASRQQRRAAQMQEARQKLTQGLLEIEDKIMARRPWSEIEAMGAALAKIAAPYPELSGALADKMIEARAEWGRVNAPPPQTKTPPPAPSRPSGTASPATPKQGGELELWTAAARAVLKDDLFEWCDVPAGPFLMGDNKQQVTLRRFLIAKYPTTYEQFQTFLDDTGAQKTGWFNRGTYNNWFTGLAAVANHKKMEKQCFTHAANLPRDSVNWYQSVAFTRWLSAGVADYLRARGVALPNGVNDFNKPGTALIRLPTEAEWEKAARGTDGRIYPWGNNFDKARCNTEESGIGKTTPVTAYLEGNADGTSPYGAADMAGNVWEWCLNPWTDPYQHVEVERVSMSDTNSRLLRGGAWNIKQDSARAAVRFNNDALSRYGSFGFRVARASPFFIES